jgi:hypothetical protein
MSKPEVTKDSLIDDLRKRGPDIHHIAYPINHWASEIFGVFNFFEKNNPGDVKHNKIKKELAEMVDHYKPLFTVYIRPLSLETRPMTPSEIMMICCGFESQMPNTGTYQPNPGPMQDHTSPIHRTHFAELIRKGKQLVGEMSRNESFTSFMTGETARGDKCERYSSSVFNYAMFGMSVQQEPQTVGERFIQLMGHFFITNEEQKDASFGNYRNYEFMTKLKIRHTLTALGFYEHEFPDIVKRIRSRSRSRSGSRSRSRSGSRSRSRGGSSLRRKKRKSKRRKS